MPVAFVQEADAASSSVTLGANATAGNTLVVAVACLGSTSATGVTGVTLGGSADNFALVTPGPSAHDTTSPNDFISVTVWADANCAGGSTAVAVTGTGVVATWVYEFSGMSGAADIAQVFPVATYQDSWLASTAQTTVPAEAWVAITCAANQAGTETLTVASGNGWTLETAYNGTSSSYFWGAASGYQTVNTVGTPAWNGNFSQGSFSVTVLVTFPVAPVSAPAAPAPAAAAIAPGVSAASGGLQVTGGISAAQVAAGSPVTQTTTSVGLIPTGVKTGNYTARPGDFVLAQTTLNRPMTVTFPTGAATGSIIGVQLINGAGGALTVQASGSDVFGAQPAGTTAIQLAGTGATFIAQYKQAAATWYIQSASYAGAATVPFAPSLGALPAAPAANSLLPGDVGLATWSYDLAFLSSPFPGTALTSGKIYLVMCPVRAGVPFSTFQAWITSAGSGLTASQNFVGVYSYSGTLLSSSADMTTAFGSTGAFSQTVTPTNAVAGPPFVWAALLSNGTTPPSLARTVNQAGMPANGGLNPRFGTLSGTYTSLPSSFGAAAPSAAAVAYWVGLN